MLEQRRRGSRARAGRRRPSARPGRRRARRPAAAPRGSRRRRRGCGRAGARPARAVGRRPPRPATPPCRRSRRCRRRGSRRAPATSRSRATSRCSSASRLKVTTTAAMRGVGRPSVTADTLRARSRPRASAGLDAGRRVDRSRPRCDSSARTRRPVSRRCRGRRPRWRRTPRQAADEPPVTALAASLLLARLGGGRVALGPVDRLGDLRPGPASMSGSPVLIIGGTRDSVETFWLAGLEGEVDEAADLAARDVGGDHLGAGVGDLLEVAQRGLRADLLRASRSSRTSGGPSASSRRSPRGRGRTRACRGRRACGCRARCSR